MKVASFIFGGTLFGAGMLYVGLHIGEARAEARLDKPVILTKTCPAPKQQTRWACDAVERREYLNVCLKRKPA